MDYYKKGSTIERTRTRTNSTKSNKSKPSTTPVAEAGMHEKNLSIGMGLTSAMESIPGMESKKKKKKANGTPKADRDGKFKQWQQRLKDDKQGAAAAAKAAVVLQMVVRGFVVRMKLLHMVLGQRLEGTLVKRSVHGRFGHNWKKRFFQLLPMMGSRGGVLIYEKKDGKHSRFKVQAGILLLPPGVAQVERSKLRNHCLRVRGIHGHSGSVASAIALEQHAIAPVLRKLSRKSEGAGSPARKKSSSEVDERSSLPQQQSASDISMSSNGGTPIDVFIQANDGDECTMWEAALQSAIVHRQLQPLRSISIPRLVTTRNNSNDQRKSYDMSICSHTKRRSYDMSFVFDTLP